MKLRLLALHVAIVAGCCATATLASLLVVDEVAAYPVFAIASFGGGFLGSRISRRRSVVEGAIAAVACGLLTLIVNASSTELQLIADTHAQSVSFAIGVGVTCLAAALAGGRLGERLAHRPPGVLTLGAAFSTAALGLWFALLPVLFLVHWIGGETAMLTVELPLLLGIPVFAALLLGVSTEHQIKKRALILGPLAIPVTAAVIALVTGATLDNAGIAFTLTLSMVVFYAGLGLIGLAQVTRLTARIGRLELEPVVPTARVHDDSRSRGA